MINTAEKQRVAADILQIAHRYNNVLYKKNYFKYGAFKKDDVNQHFGSFNKACRALKIVNPEDPYDLTAVLNDIRFVLNDRKEISLKIYREYGIYTIESLQRKYGNFNDLMIMACGRQRQLKEKTEPVPRPIYSHYPVIQRGQHIMLRWRKKLLYGRTTCKN